VFIGGYFETIAGQVCNHIAAYDKQMGFWTTLGSGVDGEVFSMAVMGNNLYVGGSFNNAGSVPARHIAMYNIATGLWSAMGAGAVRSPGAIATDGSSVYAAIYNPVNGVDYYDYLGQWNGTQWKTFGNGLNAGYIQALVWQGSTLYAAGSFSRSDDGTFVKGVAQIQSGGSWSSLNSGLNNVAYALAVSGDSLYVGGAFTQVDGMVDSSLAVWNNASQVWNPIGASGFNGSVFALTADGYGGVYAGGQFSEVAQVGRGNLVHWNGSAFGTVASGVDNKVEALATDETALYAGGWFLYSDNGRIRDLHFAALDGAGAGVSNSPSQAGITFSIYPDPASSSSTISVDLAKSSSVHIEIYNAIGNRVALVADGTYPQGQQTFTFDAGKLQPGIYFLRLTNEGITSTEHFVVQ